PMRVGTYCDSDNAHHTVDSFPTRRSSDLQAQGNSGIQRGRRHTDTCRGRSQFSFGLADIRPATQQGSAVAHRYGLAKTRCLPTLDRKSTRLNSSHVKISYAVFCLKKKKNI